MTAAFPETSPNHAFVIDTLLAKGGAPRVLDFGCGSGFFVAKARAAGLDACGVDKFDGFWTYWRDGLKDEAREHIVRVDESGLLPYPDNSFDAVTANQVFEHIPAEHLEQSIREITRVLKPGGVFLSIFPTKDVWFEGHLGLYFPHWLSRAPALQHAYLRACYALGFGYYRDGTAKAWATARQDLLNNGVIVYHRIGDVRRLWHAVVGKMPCDLELDSIRFRAGQTRFSGLASIKAIEPVLRFIHLKRAGRVLLVRKTGSTDGHA